MSSPTLCICPKHPILSQLSSEEDCKLCRHPLDVRLSVLNPGRQVHAHGGTSSLPSFSIHVAAHLYLAPPTRLHLLKAPPPCSSSVAVWQPILWAGDTG